MNVIFGLYVTIITAWRVSRQMAYCIPLSSDRAEVTGFHYLFGKSECLHAQKAATMDQSSPKERRADHDGNTLSLLTNLKSA